MRVISQGTRGVDEARARAMTAESCPLHQTLLERLVAEAEERPVSARLASSLPSRASLR